MEPLADTSIGMLYWYVGTLDSLPEYVRAMIAGGLLVVLLRLSQSRVADRDVQFSISFSKVSLVALIAIPPVVWLLPQSRLVVFVEKLEPATEPWHLAWLSLLAIWGLGFLVGAVRLLGVYLGAARVCRSLPTVAPDHELNARLRHWQRRLGVDRPLSLALTDGERPRHLPGVRRIILQRAALHWPAAARDLVIIRELCRQKRHHGRWHLFAQLVASCYWPLPWVRKLHARLLGDFEVVADNLAEACYEDRLGYRRALRQMEQRMTQSTAGSRPVEHRAGTCGHHLAALWLPQPCVDWDVDSLTRAHHRRRNALWTEPGEKLAFMIGHAALVALVVAGVTLKEVPPEVERDYSLTLDDSWMKTAFRKKKTPEPQTGFGSD